jgi:monovalent cation/proton antiporter MnhG/PhaG subunit
MNDVLAALETARHVAAGVLILIGLLGITAGVIAQIRFPDFFTRVHGALLVSAVSALVLAGLAIEAWDAGIALRLALLGVLIAILAPVRAYLLASGAHGAGLSPLVGRQR